MGPVTASMRSSRKLGRWLLGLAFAAGSGCGEPTLDLIAGGFGTDAGQGPDARQVPVATTRGRIQVSGTTLVTDRGTPLRGIDIPIDLTPNFPLSRALFEEIAQRQGLNAVEVNLEYWADPSGSHLAQADQIVAQAGEAGLYVILAIGGGPSGNGHPGNGWFDIEKVRSFWQLYAPRYKDRTHVIYQLQNQPDLSCSAPWPADTLAMEREGYTLIRSLAPETHIVLFSYREMPTPALLAGSLDQVTGLVDWSNASIGMGGIVNCVDTAHFADTLAMATQRRVPVFITALALDGWQAAASELEMEHVGWTSVRWLVHMKNFATFQIEHADVGLTWCPDFGTWPQDSRACAAR
jgi:hypothetical protein